MSIKLNRSFFFSRRACRQAGNELYNDILRSNEYIPKLDVQEGSVIQPQIKAEAKKV